ncbi:MAG: VanW family protein [Chloroflexi bacterium]|nr:VanW family protein [Chloroflexota bacterium]
MTRRQMLITTAAGGIGAAAAAASGWTAFVAVREAKLAGQFRPGAVVDGEDLAGLTFDEAVARARARWAPYIESPIVLRLGGRTWTPAAHEIGISVDFMTPIREAYAWRREAALTDQVLGRAATGPEGFEGHTVVNFDPTVFEAYLERIAVSVHLDPVDSVLRIEEQAGRRRLVVDPSREGRQLAPAGYAESVAANLRPPTRLVVDLASEAIAPAVVEDQLEPIAADAAGLLDGNIGINTPWASWKVARDSLVADVAIDGPAADPEIKISLDYASFERLARQVADRLRVAPADPRIQMSASGEVVPLDEGRAGRQVDVEKLWTRVQTAFASGESAVQAPIVIVKPDISRLTAKALQFDNVIAVGESIFWGSEDNRIHNIDHGSRLIDGAIIAPGQSFSLNETVGPITVANGFVEGLVIAPTRTEPGVGGGICQVSTTLFRALFWAGLPIDERWQHVYRVGYYELGEDSPPGFDAAIWQPRQDLRATNDTPHYLLIRREFDPVRLILRFKIFGAPIGRKVTLDSSRGEIAEPPPPVVVANPELEPGEVKQTDSAREGMKTVIYRHVALGDQVLFKDQFASLFRAWPERWEVGPNEDGSLDTSQIPEYVPPGGEAPDDGEAPADSGGSSAQS